MPTEQPTLSFAPATSGTAEPIFNWGGLKMSAGVVSL